MNLLSGFKKRVTPLCVPIGWCKFSTGPYLGATQVGKACGHSTQWQLCYCVHLLRLTIFKYLKHKTTSFRSLSHARMLNCSAVSTLSNPTDYSLPGSSVHRIFPGKSSGMGCHSLLQGIFPTQGLNLGLLHWEANSLLLVLSSSLLLSANSKAHNFLPFHFGAKNASKPVIGEEARGKETCVTGWIDHIAGQGPGDLSTLLHKPPKVSG